MPKATPEPPIDMEKVRVEIAPMVDLLETPNREAGRPGYMKHLVLNDDYAYNVYLVKNMLDNNKWKIKFYAECLKQSPVAPEILKQMRSGVKGDHWTYGLNVNHLLTEPCIQPEDEPMGEPRVWKPLQE